jgi:serine/threonine protein kinase
MVTYVLKFMDADTLGGVLNKCGGCGIPHPTLAEDAAWCL